MSTDRETVPVSVVIPTHKRSDLLKEAINSVLAQRCLPREIIVVDDALDDATAAHVTSFAARGSGIPIVYVPRTSGHPTASASRNLGARQSTQPLLGFLDDDDVWDHDYLRTMVDRLHDTCVDFVISNMRVMSDGTDLDTIEVAEDLRSHDVVAKNPGFMGSNFIIERSAFWTVGGFDEALPVSNDKDLFVRLLRQNHSYAVVAPALARYRRHSGERLTSHTVTRAHGMARYREKHQGYLSLGQFSYLTRRCCGEMLKSDAPWGGKTRFVVQEIAGYARHVAQVTIAMARARRTPRLGPT